MSLLDVYPTVTEVVGLPQLSIMEGQAAPRRQRAGGPAAKASPRIHFVETGEWLWTTSAVPKDRIDYPPVTTVAHLEGDRIAMNPKYEGVIRAAKHRAAIRAPYKLRVRARPRRRALAALRLRGRPLDAKDSRRRRNPAVLAELKKRCASRSSAMPACCPSATTSSRDRPASPRTTGDGRRASSSNRSRTVAHQPPYAWVVEYRPLDRCATPSCRIRSRDGAWVGEGRHGRTAIRARTSRRGRASSSELFFERGVVLRPGESFNWICRTLLDRSELDLVVAATEGGSGLRRGDHDERAARRRRAVPLGDATPCAGGEPALRQPKRRRRGSLPGIRPLTWLACPCRRDRCVGSASRS